MRYVPFGPELDGVPNVILGGPGNDATLLTLGNRPGNRTPEELKADTNVEIVLKLLRSPGRETYLAGAQAVSLDRYDADGLLALWAMLEPEAALERQDLIVHVAKCAAFERWAGEQATKIACALRAPVRSGDAIGSDNADLADTLAGEALELLPRLLDHVDDFAQRWREEYDAVVADRELFSSAEAALREAPDLDLAVFQLPRALRSMALYEQTDCTRIVVVREEHSYEVRYRYESWVDLQSRRPPPRIDLQPFVEMLETFEGSPGVWLADDVREPRPRLRLRDPDTGEAEASSLTPGLFVRLFAAYLRDNAANAELQWSPGEAVES